MRIKKFTNNKYIGEKTIEVVSFPSSDSLQNQEFLNLIINFAHISELNNSCLELLWVSEKTDNQLFNSLPHLYVVIRKLSNNQNKCQEDLKLMGNEIDSFLRRLNYDTVEIDIIDEKFHTLLTNSDFDTTFVVAKKERLLNFNSSYVYNWDMLNSDSDNDLSQLISSIAQSNGAAFSLSIFPTSLKPEEKMIINNLQNYYNNSHIINNPIITELINGISKTVSNFDSPFYYYTISVFGNRNACVGIASKFVSLANSGLQKNSNKEMITLDISKENVSLLNNYFNYPWIINSLMINKYRDKNIFVFPTVKTLLRMPYLMTTEEINVFFRVPFYNKFTPFLKEKRDLNLNETLDASLTGENTIVIGELIGLNGEKLKLGVPYKSWTQHALIVGKPGTGKTTFAVNILTQFANKGIPFLAIEPTKTEYRAMIDAIEGIQIFTPGSNNVSPYIVNPFIPPKGMTIEKYIPSLLNAFKIAFPMEGVLEMLFLKSINACYIEYGYRSDSYFGDLNTKPFGMFEYIKCFKRTMKTLNYSKDVQNNLESAGLLRLMNLLEQNANVFDNINNISVEDLLSKPTVIELNAIDNSDQKALIMSLLLTNIVAYTKNNFIGDGNLKNVILIDEAHVLLKTKNNNGTGDRNPTAEIVQNMIKEIRSYGTSVIISDQDPSMVSEGVVADTNVKVVFKLTSDNEKSIIARNSGMSKENEEYISYLKLGQAFLSFDKLNSPKIIQTEDTRARDGIRLSVSDNEIAERVTYWKDKKHNLTPYSYCKHSPFCKECNFILRNDAEFYSSKVVGLSIEKLNNKKDVLNVALKIPAFIKKHVQNKYDDKCFNILSFCVSIKYLRKVQLNTKIELNEKDVEVILKRTIEKMEGNY